MLGRASFRVSRLPLCLNSRIFSCYTHITTSLTVRAPIDHSLPLPDRFPDHELDLVIVDPQIPSFRAVTQPRVPQVPRHHPGPAHTRCPGGSFPYLPGSCSPASCLDGPLPVPAVFIAAEVVVVRCGWLLSTAQKNIGGTFRPAVETAR